MPLKTDGSRNVLLVFGCELVVVENRSLSVFSGFSI